MARRRVLITGAGSGLGQALAQRYARHGDRVACVDLDAARAELTRASLPGDGHLAIAANVGSDDAMEQVHERIAREWGGVDVLVNNAGIATGGAMVDTTMAEWRNVLEINLLGVVRGCRLFLPGMVAGGGGQVVNTASFAGLAGAPIGSIRLNTWSILDRPEGLDRTVLQILGEDFQALEAERP